MSRVDRSFGAARLALGAALLARPDVPAQLTGTRSTPGVRALTRVLGARYAGQGAVALAVPHRPRVDAGIEMLHAVSMLPVVVLHPQAGRLALLSAVTAAGLAAAEMTVR